MTEILSLTAYFAERQRSGERFLADAMLDLFEREGVAASMMLRGIAGFGTTHVLRTDRSLTLSEDPPVTVTAVDLPDRIRTLADAAVGLTRRGLITLERAWLLPGSLPADLDGWVRLSLYLGRKQPVAGVPGYVAVCEVLHRLGFVAADVFLGVDGTVAGERRRARFFSHNTDVPVLITGIGTRTQALAAVDELTGMLASPLFSLRPVVVCKIDGRTLATPPRSWPVQKLTVHTSEDTRHEGRPVHRALMARLRATDHAGGATALRGLWGFRGSQRPHGDRFLQLGRRVPVTTVLVDTAETMAADYGIVDAVTAEHGVVTCEPVPALIAVNGDKRRGSLTLD
ncbi:hypothetical protein BST22_17790 [Mycolicibacterium chubuense]|uniref:DUF190 domain-containing protein n=1 Tax=Mycolicibacterium chubuense TaxID=1800 RepID=A0A0J6WQ52_MYCCU|nr:hypothetical protein MCHUDSM44219_00312 [Mycolicibacterium chubuense]ORA48933.1 hypothetical protein BST22_17790 [Mycolicibacterium chubuense]SPY00751.1 Uncharacterized ACR, COG1993 [Mycolicibacterium chubuense]